MPRAAVVGSGPRLFLVELPEGPPHSFPRPVPPRPLPGALLDAVRSLPAGTGLAAAESDLRTALSRETGRPFGEPTREELRAVRARLPPPPSDAERSYLLAVARARLEAALRAPEEVLTTLAREEERLERALGREEHAAESLVAVPDSPVDRYARAWTEARSALARHHATLRSTVEAEARKVLPNLSSVVGPRVAARLLSAAGSLAALGRLRAPRLQLLGSRRRPSADRGPRYGLLYRAERMDDVPAARRGAYARTLAALAVVAARADVYTHADLSARLVARRDRRVDDLGRRRR